MAVSSTGWGALIAGGAVLAALGAILAAVGNVNLSAARDRERAVAAGEKALSMIKMECNNNLAHLKQMRQALTNQQIPLDRYETSTWSVVSSGGLLVQVDTDTLGQLVEIYHFVELSNEQQTQLMEATVGIASAVQGSEKVRVQRMQFLTALTDRLEEKLLALNARLK